MKNIFKLIVMSKGPIIARINQIERAEDFHALKVEQLEEQFFHGKKESLKLPHTVDISALAVGDVITYYTAEEGYGCESEILLNREERVVLIFKRMPDGIGLPLENKFFWIEEGTPLLELKKLPRIVNILLSLSAYYGKREDLVIKALDILKLSQDAEAVDALFSMRPEVLDPLLEMEYAVVPVQIADSLLNLVMMGADLEHPRCRDLRYILSLAVIHGEPQEVVNEFIEAYQRE